MDIQNLQKGLAEFNELRLEAKEILNNISSFDIYRDQDSYDKYLKLVREFISKHKEIAEVNDGRKI